MSLLHDYSSDEGDAIDVKDAFSLGSLPAAKKPRIEEQPPTKVLEAAPHVLSEVC